MNKIQYGKAPEIIGQYNNLNTDELMLYQYLPIKMPNQQFQIPKQLDRYMSLITDAHFDAWQKKGCLEDRCLYYS